MRHNLARFRIACALIAVCAMAAACSSGSQGSAKASSGAKSTVKLLVYPGTSLSWVGYIADQKGYFAQNNLKVDFVKLPAGAQATAALAAGSINLAMLDLFNTGPLLSKGVKLKVILGEQKTYWGLVGSKSQTGQTLSDVIKTLDTVSVPSIGGAGGRLTQYLADVYGRNGSDVKLVADIGGTAFLGGKVPAMMYDPITVCEAQGEGYPLIFSFLHPPQPKDTYPDEVQALLGSEEFGYWGQASWVDSHKKAVTAMQKALTQTIDWANKPANAAAVSDILRKSSFNIPNLSDSAFESCVAATVSGLNSAFPKSDVKAWSDALKTLGLTPSGLPPTSQWFAAGLPQ